MEIPLPSLETQRAILTEWRKAQDKIAAAKRTIDQLIVDRDRVFCERIGLIVDILVTRRGPFVLRLKEMERWDTFFYRPDFVSLDRRLHDMRAKPLGELLRFITRHWSPEEFPSGEFQYIEISGVNKEEGIIAAHPVDIEKAPSRATTLVKSGDILISTTRPYLGAHARVPQKYNGCVCSSGFALADHVASTSIDPDYVVFFLKSAPGLRQMERRMTGGLYPAIVQTELEKVLVPLPPISIQREAMKEAETFRARISSEREAAQETARRIEADLEAWLLGNKKVVAS